MMASHAFRAEHSLEYYYTPEHTYPWFRVYAGVMGDILYPFGIPSGYTVVLYRGRASLEVTVTPETSTTNVSALGNFGPRTTPAPVATISPPSLFPRGC